MKAVLEDAFSLDLAPPCPPSDACAPLVGRRACLASLLAMAAACAPRPRTSHLGRDGALALIVPFARGGSADTWARLVASKLASTLRREVLVEDLPGLGGNVGTAKAAASNDDRTILFGSVGPLVVHPFTYGHLAFDPARDFTPVALLESSPLLLVVHPSVRATSIAELIALAKAQPGVLSFASNGKGSPEHVAGEVFARRARVVLRHVPFDGAGPARRALQRGEASLMFDPSKAALPLVREGRLRALATANPTRLRVLPDVATFWEAAIADFELRIWTGLFLPAGSPTNASTLLEGVGAAITDPQLLRTIASQGGEPGPRGLDELQGYLEAERRKWSALALESGVSHVEAPV